MFAETGQDLYVGIGLFKRWPVVVRVHRGVELQAAVALVSHGGTATRYGASPSRTDRSRVRGLRRSSP
jgi:hypothetical protein